ncbi:MAG: DNA cytosine methyltransferase [Candidatus Methanomethylicaceae archaeon]
MSLPAIDLFAGGGGMSYGFREAGFQMVFACDIDKDVAKTYKANFPETTYLIGDVHHIDPEKVMEITGLRKGDLTVMIAGPPCQGFSMMGLRNPNDPRNRLLPEVLKFAEAMKPLWIVIENVPGLLTMEKGEPLREIYRGMTKIGYKCAHRVLSALDYGVPQKRQRVFFIANNTGDPITFPAAEYGDPSRPRLERFSFGEGGNANYKRYFVVRDAIGDLPSLLPGEEKDYYVCAPFSEYQRMMREGAPQKLHNHKAPNHTPSVVERIRKAKPGEKVPYRFSFEKRRLKWDEPSPTLLDGPRPTWHYAHPEDDRGLSVRERARIMSFPDKFIFVGQIPKQRMITGDAVPPLMARAVAMEIKKYL